MPIIRSFVFLLAAFFPVLAVDFGLDASFSPTFAANDRVRDVHVLSDGRLLVAGGFCSINGSSTLCNPFLIRMNPDGTRDMTFNVAISTPTGSNGGMIYAIKPLPDGKFLITGEFNIGTQRSNYARINADGSFDLTLPPTFVEASYGYRTFAVQADGKMIVGTPRTINGELYKVAHRINADGTPDPTFRITFLDGNCGKISVLSSGKILITVSTDSGQTQVKPLHRLNSDGSRDDTFDAALPVGSYAQGLTVLSDGRILLNSSQQGNNYQPGKRLTPNGALDLDIPLCPGSIFLPQADGSTFVGGCKRWTFYYGNPMQWARIYADGSVDQTMDNIRFENHNDGTISGFREAGNSKYYVFGGFQGFSGDYSRRKLLRLMPNTTPKRAKFDFDGDGKSDIAVYRPSNGYWYLNQSTAGINYFPWGFSTDTVAAAHFDNDGRTDFGVFRDGTWHGWSSLLSSWRPIQLGTTGDKPMPADLDELGPTIQDQLVRGVRNGVPKWFIREGQYVIHQGPWQAQEYTLAGEMPADKPVTADFNGDSRDEFGYFQNGRWYTVDYFSYAPPKEFQWGVAGDIPVPGDYDGDRQDDYAVFRPSTGTWWIARSSLGAIAVQFGISTDIPVPADYDGDGKQDIAIYRNGEWWQYLSTTGTFRVDNWGTATDKPIQAQAQ